MGDDRSIDKSKSWKPTQRVSQKKKFANDMAHIKQTANYFISSSSFGESASGTSDGERFEDLYNLYNGRLPGKKWEKDNFGHVTDFYSNKTTGEKHTIPAKIRMNNYLSSNINLLIGEYSKRPNPFILKHEGDTGFTAYNANLAEAINSNLQQSFLQFLASQGVPVDQLPPEELPTPEAVKEQFDSTYIDNTAAKASKKIKDFQYEQEFKPKKILQFLDWAVAGRIASYRGIKNNKLVFEEIGPMELDYGKSNHLEFIEDGEFAVRKQRWLLADIIDEFGDEMTKEEYESLQKEYMSHDIGSFSGTLGPGKKEQGNAADVYHWAYKTEKKVGLWTFIDPDTGLVETAEVDDSFKIVPELKDIHISIEWEWRPQVFEGFRVRDDMFFRIEENEACSDLNKLPFNGAAYSDRFSENTSILQQGIPYATMIAILNYKFEQTIAKSKGKIIPVDMGALPKKNGWTELKAFYYGDVFGFLPLDRTDGNADKSFNQYSAIDMGLWDHAKSIIEATNVIKANWDESLGITRQRKGEVYATDTVSGTERANFQSAVISDHVFSKFDRCTLRDLNHYLELLKYLEIQGEKDLVFDDVNYMMQVFEYLPEDFTMNETLRFHYIDSTKEKENLEMLKGHAVQSLANKGDLSTVAEILDQDSMAELKRRLMIIKRQEIELQQQMAESESASAQELEAMKAQTERESKELEHQLDVALQDHKYDREEQLEAVKQQVAPPAVETDNSISDAMNARMKAQEIATREKAENDKNKVNAAKIASDHNISMMNDATKREEIASKERIAKDNNRTALKNKVVGE